MLKKTSKVPIMSKDGMGPVKKPFENINPNTPKIKNTVDAQFRKVRVTFENKNHLK